MLFCKAGIIGKGLPGEKEETNGGVRQITQVPGRACEQWMRPYSTFSSTWLVNATHPLDVRTVCLGLGWEADGFSLGKAGRRLYETNRIPPELYLQESQHTHGPVLQVLQSRLCWASFETPRTSTSTIRLRLDRANIQYHVASVRIYESDHTLVYYSNLLVDMWLRVALLSSSDLAINSLHVQYSVFVFVFFTSDML